MFFYRPGIPQKVPKFSRYQSPVTLTSLRMGTATNGVVIHLVRGRSQASVDVTSLGVFPPKDFPDLGKSGSCVEFPKELRKTFSFLPVYFFCSIVHGRPTDSSIFLWSIFEPCRWPAHFLWSSDGWIQTAEPSPGSAAPHPRPCRPSATVVWWNG